MTGPRSTCHINTIIQCFLSRDLSCTVLAISPFKGKQNVGERSCLLNCVHLEKKKARLLFWLNTINEMMPSRPWGKTSWQERGCLIAKEQCLVIDSSVWVCIYVCKSCELSSLHSVNISSPWWVPLTKQVNTWSSLKHFPFLSVC